MSKPRSYQTEAIIIKKTNAYPIIKKYNVPATIFLATGHIGTGNLLWWDKVRYVIWNTALETLEFDEIGKHHLKNTSSRLPTMSSIDARLKQLPDNNRNLVIEGKLCYYTSSAR